MRRACCRPHPAAADVPAASQQDVVDSDARSHAHVRHAKSNPAHIKRIAKPIPVPVIDVAFGRRIEITQDHHRPADATQKPLEAGRFQLVRLAVEGDLLHSIGLHLPQRLNRFVWR